MIFKKSGYKGRGAARLGNARPGMDQGKGTMFHVEHFRGAWLGLAGQGWHGKARQGEDQGKGRMFHVEYFRGAWLGVARLGQARQGQARHGSRNKNIKQKETKMSEYRGGVPTDVDIKRLRESFPESKMKEGETIEYEKIEDLLGVNKDQCRFKTVTTRWRRLVMRDYGIVIGCKTGEGFKILTDSEKLNLSVTKVKYAKNSMRRSVNIASKINTRRLSDEDLKKLNVYNEKTAKSLAILQIKKKQILPEM